MRALRRLFPFLFALTLLAGGAHTVMTGTLANELVRGAVRDALAAGTLGGVQQPVEEARRYLRLHEMVVGRLSFLAPRPESSELGELGFRLKAVEIYADALAGNPKGSGEEGMKFAVEQLTSVQSMSAGVWRPDQARVSAVVFWALFIATVGGGISRIRSRRPPDAEPEPGPTREDDPA